MQKLNDKRSHPAASAAKMCLYLSGSMRLKQLDEEYNLIADEKARDTRRLCTYKKQSFLMCSTLSPSSTGRHQTHRRHSQMLALSLAKLEPV